MAKHQKTKEEILKDFRKIEKALGYFPGVKELNDYPGGSALYKLARDYWGTYYNLREAMSPDAKAGKDPDRLIVMVISLDEGIRQYVARFLSKRGYVTFEVTKIKEALQKLSDHKYVLAVVDKNNEKEAAGFINKLRARGGQVVMLETPFASEFLELQVIHTIQKWPKQSRPPL